MGNVGGPRHHLGGTPAPIAWVCPSCRAKNTSRFEEGCPACGANTLAANAAAQVANQPPVDVAGLVLGDVVKASMSPEMIHAFTRLKPYTLEARETVAAALAFAAENGMAQVEGGLTPREMTAWARAITAADDE